MSKIVLAIIGLTAAVECGLLKEIIQPVTDNVHKGQLFNQKEQKQEGKETKGVLDKLVNRLDEGADKLVNALTSGFNSGSFDDNKDGLSKAEMDGKPETNLQNISSDTDKLDEIKKGIEVDKDVVNKNETAIDPEKTKIDQTTPKVSEITTPKVEEITTPKKEELTTPKGDLTTPKVEDVTTPKLEEIKPAN